MQHVQQIHERPSKAYAWLTFALFACFALLLGAAILMQPADMQLAQNEAPLPVPQVIPPITQPVSP
jgi:hypothetical protein